MSDIKDTCETCGNTSDFMNEQFLCSKCESIKDKFGALATFKKSVNEILGGFDEIP